jgi:hypothetical protein
MFSLSKKYNTMKLKLLTLLIIILSLCSCDKKDLGENEKNIVEKFLIYEWSDLKFSSLGEDKVINDTRLKFSKNGSNLNYSWDVGYNAIFGSKQYHDEGKVEISYSNKQKGILISLYDKKNKLLQEGLIEIEKDSIISKLSKQIEYRKYLTDFLNRSKLEQFYFDREIRGVFQSVINEGNLIDNYEEIDNFTPVALTGLQTKFKSTIEWKMKEVYDPIKKNYEIKYDDLKDEFNKTEIESILTLLKGPLKYFDSNIKSEKKFKSNEYQLELSPEMNYDNNTNDYTIEANKQNFDFILNKKTTPGRSFLFLNGDPNDETRISTKITLRIEGSIKYDANQGRSVTYEYAIKKDNLYPDRLYFIDHYKYFILEKAN